MFVEEIDFYHQYPQGHIEIRLETYGLVAYLKFHLGDNFDDFLWYVGSRFMLAQNWAVRLEYNHRDRDNDVLFSVQAYF